MELRFGLHGKQQEVFNDPARFKIVAAGRQSGKTTLAVCSATVAALADFSWGGIPLTTEHEVGYFYPTFEQGKKVVWPRLKAKLLPFVGSDHVYENTGLIVFPNGRRLRLLGADNPDASRGFTFSHVILDEYKDMPAILFPEIIRPALGVTQGSALFIGTPKGKNHFYELFKHAEGDETGEYRSFSFSSSDNPHIPPSEITSMARTMSAQLIAQELEASFVAEGGKYFKPEQFEISPHEPDEGDWAIACDLAGFSQASARSKDYEKRDESAIAVVKVHQAGWWVKEIEHGRWDVRETALKILLAAKRTGCPRVGIEKGIGLTAVSPYMTDLMRQYGRWIEIIPLTHGNKRKPDRIQWALQGRAEKREIKLNPGAWNKRFLDQASDFPDHRSHDDLLDALAYIDQMAQTNYLSDFNFSQGYQPLDRVSGY